MNVQEQIKVLKEQIYSSQELLTKLEDQIKKEQEFPKIGDTYWRIDDIGSVESSLYNDYFNDNHRRAIGNLYKTKREAEFVVEKLKVEAELRKFSGTFKHGGDNYTFNFNHDEEKIVHVYASESYEELGSLYFESAEKSRQAVEAVGEERIKKYIFGVEG